jgi:hypothetical protein
VNPSLDRESRDTMRGIESIAAPDMKN